MKPTESRVTRQILIYAVVNVGLSYARIPIAHLGLVYLIVASVAGVEFIFGGLALAGAPSSRAGMQSAGRSLISSWYSSVWDSTRSSARHGWGQ